ncbi:AraC family transcriptional regulator [Nannocystis radixulma]|uniref:AraC family transcriptional regulator n=1 Tax=Nannocystis radixulma TaxID=2995305 RepID=A0ABT5B5T9_9BACT|nr:AraC family transcriptional regulator [Nannocystis radixulma]MDC0668421.1 AraC family transcriptional regulator [Nannocystis radixulma]
MVDAASTLAPVDPLAGVLDLVRLRGTVLGVAELGAPWGLRSPGFEDLACHIVVRGGAHLELPGRRPRTLALRAGDVALVAAGQVHAVRDAPRSGVVPFRRLRHAPRVDIRTVRWGGDGPRTTLVVGCLELDTAGRDLLAAALPPVLHLPAETASASQLGLVHALASEVAQPGPGAEPVLTRLAELLFIHALRARIAAGAVESGWLRALADPAIARVLAAVHADPGAAWTVATMAARAGMSRSAFAPAFHRLVGEPPLAYVTTWRMRTAARALVEDGPTNLKALAARVGYGSDEAFSRAFKNWAGTPPGQYRRAAREAAKRVHRHPRGLVPDPTPH